MAGLRSDGIGVRDETDRSVDSSTRSNSTLCHCDLTSRFTHFRAKTSQAMGSVPGPFGGVGQACQQFGVIAARTVPASLIRAAALANPIRTKPAARGRLSLANAATAPAIAAAASTAAAAEER